MRMCTCIEIFRTCLLHVELNFSHLLEIEVDKYNGAIIHHNGTPADNDERKPIMPVMIVDNRTNPSTRHSRPNGLQRYSAIEDAVITGRIYSSILPAICRVTGDWL